MALGATVDLQGLSDQLVVRDSKLLTVRQRERLGEVIQTTSSAVAVCVVGVSEINRRGINWAKTQAFARLIAAVEADAYLVDGRWTLPALGARERRVRCQIRADTSVPAALAAGVIAKLFRDAKATRALRGVLLPDADRRPCVY
jgi:ribonuclease HII